VYVTQVTSSEISGLYRLILTSIGRDFGASVGVLTERSWTAVME
jgi:hypothetical protein